MQCLTTRFLHIGHCCTRPMQSMHAQQCPHGNNTCQMQFVNHQAKITHRESSTFGRRTQNCVKPTKLCENPTTLLMQNTSVPISTWQERHGRRVRVKWWAYTHSVVRYVQRCAPMCIRVRVSGVHLICSLGLGLGLHLICSLGHANSAVGHSDCS